jgi:cell division protein FtsB
MTPNKSSYNSQNVFVLLGIFGVIFYLLYALASFIHESEKINQEIESIRLTNEKLENKILEKKDKVEYLQTTERIEKEAKTQLGKKRVNEKVLVFIDDTLESAIAITSDDALAENMEQPLSPKKIFLEEWLKLFWPQKS